ncbi:conserved protein of unknown function [Georgfuchsia toluolica]|uniref:Uncharacterized protein n=1 Tax=Georgfuchsia toluolica TaxID=424218 RepID=A0A916J6B9_9PROT|nr:hypothetical protein [Georgfuchsia toluolica]CAG4884776.1 conserved protein of unknown function [Georgfuchsia toluolica]
MSKQYEIYEGLIPGDGNPNWGQSFYYNFYDPTTKVAALIRLGLHENHRESNTWFIFFKDGLPIFNRVNMNLPYTYDRPANGVKIAGMYIHAVEPLKKTRIVFSSKDFSVDLAWDELHPLEDAIAIAQNVQVFPTEMAHIHLEGTSRVSGHIIHRGDRTEINGTGFRDIGAGPRNWDCLAHYRLAWPIFENGTALAGLRAVSTDKQTSYMRMYHDGKKWLRVKDIEAKQTYADDTFSIASGHWKFTDENDRKYEFTFKPLLRWFFSLDNFIMCEQIAEYRMSDGTVGYGMCENGYRLPWKGFDV